MIALKNHIYKHYKNSCLYLVIGTAKHSEDGKRMVIYKALYGDMDVWVRPEDMFEETVEREGKTVHRFAVVGRME